VSDTIDGRHIMGINGRHTMGVPTVLITNSGIYCAVGTRISMI
jgi:hypothetical protein